MCRREMGGKEVCGSAVKLAGRENCPLFGKKEEDQRENMRTEDANSLTAGYRKGVRGQHQRRMEKRRQQAVKKERSRRQREL